MVLVTVIGADCIANGAIALASIVDQAGRLAERTSVLYEAAYADHLPTKRDNVQFGSVGAACLCCIGGPVLRTQIIRCLRQDQPQRIVIVGGLAAQLSAIVDALLTPTLHDHIKLDQVLWAQSKDVPVWAPNHAASVFSNAQLETASKVMLIESVPEQQNGSENWLKKESFSPHPINLNWLPAWHPLSDQNSAPELDCSMAQMFWPSNIVFDRLAAIQTVQTLQTKLALPMQVVLRTERAWYFGQTQIDLQDSFNAAQWVWRETAFRQFSAVRINGLDLGSKDINRTSNEPTNVDQKMHEWWAGLDECRRR